jgi:serine/threonine protein kinase
VNQRICFLSPTIQGGWEEESSLSDFTISKQLGQGAYGKVYRAVQNKTQLVYALKEINKL